jgi:hypothetical protein
MKITNIRAMRSFLSQNSGFSSLTIDAVIETLGYPLQGSGLTFNQLSAELESCAEHGADCGFTGFSYYSETIPFFTFNRQDIAIHMENMAVELGTDIISMVQGFGVFRHGKKPIAGEIGKALYDSSETWADLSNLYNVFAWYALEEVSRTWYRYLEENPAVRKKMPA